MIDCNGGYQYKGEESWNAQNGGGDYEHHGGAIGFARAKDALKTEGGEATAQAP